MEDVVREVKEICERAVLCKRGMILTTEEQRMNAMVNIASAIIENEDVIIKENEKDIIRAKENGLTSSLIDRLTLSHERLVQMSRGVREVAGLPEVLGKVISENERPNGLIIKKVSVPIGVVAIIFEARPNVTVDSAALCLKSGNVCILRGGKEAINSNKILVQIMRDSLKNSKMDENCIQLVTNTSHDSANALMTANDYVDVLIPRGGKGLINTVCLRATVPVIKTGAGTCHIYVDKAADLDMAAEIVYNAKTSRPSVCNACECMLIHKDVAKEALVKINNLLSKKNVEIRGDERVCEILPHAVFAKADDFGAEFLDYIIAARVVDSIDDAIDHITKYGTLHSECIVTEDESAAEYFLDVVDASSVYRNASTRFTDGGEFGFGAEIGISTQKLHARGPLGLPELTSYKYKIYGKGQVR